MARVSGSYCRKPRTPVPCEAMTVALRTATANDAECIYGFILELAECARSAAEVKTSPATLREQLQQPTPPFECLIAEWAPPRQAGAQEPSEPQTGQGAPASSEPVGFALFFNTYSTWRGARGLYLEDLFVSPHARKQGVGRALLQRLAQLALERRCARLEWAALKDNQLAIDFYLGLKAQPLSDWTGFRLSDAALAQLAGRQ